MKSSQNHCIKLISNSTEIGANNLNMSQTAKMKRAYTVNICSSGAERSKYIIYQLKKEGILSKFHSRNKSQGEFDKGLKTHTQKDFHSVESNDEQSSLIRLQTLAQLNKLAIRSQYKPIRKSCLLKSNDALPAPKTSIYQNKNGGNFTSDLRSIEEDTTNISSNANTKFYPNKMSKQFIRTTQPSFISSTKHQELPLTVH